MNEKMSLGEVARWLTSTGDGWWSVTYGWATTSFHLEKCADAIRDHLATCKQRIDPEKVRAIVEGFRNNRLRTTEVCDALFNLLPPEPSPLEQAKAMAREKAIFSVDEWRRKLLALLDQVKEAK